MADEATGNDFTSNSISFTRHCIALDRPVVCGASAKTPEKPAIILSILSSGSTKLVVE